MDSFFDLLYNDIINFTSSDTPSEIRKKCECTDGEDKLFDLYINTRYDDREEVSDEEIETIKKQL